MPFGELLEQHRIHLELVTIHRERLTSFQVSGVVRQFSKRLVLVELVAETGPSQGFSLIRREDLTRIDRNTERLRQALKKFGAVARTHPIAREIDLSEWRSAIASAQAIAPCLTLHREGIGDPITFSAKSIQLLKHLIVGEQPNPTVADEGEFALALDHLSRIDIA